MVRIGRLLLSLIVPFLVMLPGAGFSAEPPAPESGIIPADGTVIVGGLLPAGPKAPGRAIPFRIPDPLVLEHAKQALRAGGAPAPTQAVSGTPVASTLVVSAGGIGIDFAESGGYVPPDTQVGAGPSHVFEAVNLEGRIWSKAGFPGAGPVASFSLNTFFNLSPSALLSDPRVRFDPASGRWFFVVISYNISFTSGAWRLAVSTSSDPTGSWVLYTLATNRYAEDFPALGISNDKVVLTANAFRGNLFLGTEFLVLSKADLVAGAAAHYVYFPPPQGLFSIQPAQALSSTATLYMAAVAYGSATQVEVWSVTGVPGGVGGVTVTAVTGAINTLSIPPDAVQAGTSTLIATNDNRLLDAVYRDGALWLSANDACTPAGDTATRACVRLIEILTSGTSTVAQDFDVSLAGGYYYYAAVALDNLDNLVTVFSASSGAQFPSVYASGQKAGVTNTFEAPTLIKAGEAPYELSPARWGDYSGTGIDPSNQAYVWVAGEYALSDSTWGTWISALTLQ